MPRDRFLLYRKDLVTLTCESLSYKAKTLRGMRTRAEEELVANATALGARVRKRTLCSNSRKVRTE